MVMEQDQSVGLVAQDDALSASSEILKWIWKGDYAPCMRIPPPRMFPDKALNEGIPTPNGDAISRFQIQKGLMVDRLGHRKFTSPAGFDVVYPVAVMADNSRIPLIDSQTPDSFSDEWQIAGWKFQPSEQWVSLSRNYYQVAAMITGGMDNGLEIARTLEAIDIASAFEMPGEGIPVAINGKLQERFGLLGLPSTFLSKLGETRYFIENIYQHDLLDAARQHFEQNPGLVLTYMIGEIAKLSAGLRVKPGSNDRTNLELYSGRTSHNFIRKLEILSDTLTQINIGQTTAERNDFVYTNINDAISYLRDILMSETQPHAFAVANKAVFEKTGMDYSMRFNSHYLSLMFNHMMVDEGIVSEKALDEGRIQVRANIKPARALIAESFKNEIIRQRVMDLARKSGLINAEGISKYHEASVFSQIPQAIDAFDKLIAGSVEEGMVNPNSSEIHQLIDWVKDRMREQYDIVRARVYVDSKRGMNTAIGRVENILATLDDKARKEYGKRAEAYIRAWVYTWDGVSDEQVFKEAASGEDNSYGKDPAGYLARSIRGLAQETLGYHAYHAHVPVYFGLGQNQNGVTSFKMNAVEMQFVYSFTRPMLDALERTYKSVVQTMRGAGFKPEYVQRILAIAQKGARKVLEEEVTGIVEKKSRSTGPYKGILMDFDGTMFETGPLYQKAMENVAKRFGVDPALFMEVFKFERSMGESCRNFVGKIMDKTIVGDTDGEIASELERKLFSPEIVARMNKVAFTPFDEKYLESQEVMAELLAQYIEREGQQLIRNDPQEARKTFVRPVPGFFDFLNKLPDDIIICPTSSARWTTIEEVFRLYGLLKDKRIKAKFSEEDAVTLSGNARLAHKPQLDYYLRARQVLNTVLKDGTYLPSGDLLILGDNAKAEWSPVFAEMEDGLTTVLVSDKDARLVTSTDDNVAKTNSYYELAKLSQDDLAANAAVRGDPLVIERMRQTLKRKKFGMADLLRGFMVSRN